MEDTAAAVAPAPEAVDEDTAAMAAVWRKNNAPEEAPEPEPAAEAPEEAPQEPTAEEAAEPELEPEAEPVEAVEAPDHLPSAIKAQWAAIPPEAREAINAAHLRMGERLAEQGRVTAAAKPVYDVLVGLARSHPAVANMPPAAIAQEVAQLYSGLQQDPVRTLAAIAQNYGALDGLRAALNGQPAPPPAAPDPRRLAAAIPDLVAREVERRVTEHQALSSAEQTAREFAASKPLWADVEGDLPDFIRLVQKQRPGASPKDTLDAAYDMAIHARPELRAKVQAAAIPAPAQPDPARTEAQLRAKAVNVPASRPTTSPRMTEDEIMQAIYRRNHG